MSRSRADGNPDGTSNLAPHCGYLFVLRTPCSVARHGLGAIPSAGENCAVNVLRAFNDEMSDPASCETWSCVGLLESTRRDRDKTGTLGVQTPAVPND